MSDIIVPTSVSQEIETRKVSINKLFTDFWFRVPEYQGSYVWGQEEIDELLDDIAYAQRTAKDKEYFLGSVVLQKYQRKQGELTYTCYDLLDGQQRLTTLFLMMAVLRDQAVDQKLQVRAREAIFQEENPYENQPERIRVEFLIRDAVGDFIEKFVRSEGGTNERESLEALTAERNVSIANMAKALLYVSEMMSKLKQRSPVEFNQFAIFLFNKVIVIYVASESLEDAFRLFTILNDRGIPLSNSDILKSMNIGAVANDNKRRQYAVMWEELEGEFGRDEFDRFLGHIRTVTVKEKARENLLREFEKIYDAGLLHKGEPTLQKIKTYRDLYANLIWFENEEFTGDCRLRNLIAIMVEELSTDWIPPLLSYVDRFGKHEAFPFLSRLESKYVADWICQLTPTVRIQNTNVILKAIEKASRPEDVLTRDEIFAYDREQVRRVLDGPIYAKSFGAYIMLKVESLWQDKSQPFAPFTHVSIEHVLPQKPKAGSEWLGAFTEDQRKLWTDRLANLVLLSRIKNSEMSNREFAEKKAKYFKSSINVFPNVVKVMRSEEWTPKVLEDRQVEMLSLLMNWFR